MLSTRSKLFRAVARFLALWCTALWSGAPTLVARAATLEEQTAKAAVDVQRSLIAIEDGQRDAPRDRWDPQYVVDQVGFEPAALFGWVRGEVAWVPYRGLLRGPVGVLMDRVGNSLDTSLLLAKLLATAGHDVRLAHQDLSPDAAEGAWRRMQLAARAVAEVPPPVAEVATGAVVSAAESEAAAVAKQYGLDVQATIGQVSASADTARSQVSDLDARVADQGRRLLALVAAPDPVATRKAETDVALAALRDHWWVQLRDGGTWRDLDPLDPSGEIGHALGTATATLAPDALPVERVHRVVVRLVAEQWKDGKTRERTVLEHEVRPADVVGERITLTQLPTEWPLDWKTVTPEDMQVRLFAALRSQREWLPILQVGNQTFQQASVRSTGELNPNPSLAQNPFFKVSVPTAGRVGQVADVFDDLFAAASGTDRNKPGGAPSAGGKAAARDEGELTAEWLEYEIRSPEQPPRTVRRELFDLIGPARRAAGDLAKLSLGDDQVVARSGAQLTETSILILPCELAPEFLVDLAARSALANKPLLDDFAADPFAKAPANFVEILGKMVPLPGPSYALAALRFANGATRHAVFVDRPTIIAEHGVLVHVGPGKAVVNLGLDWITNGVGVDPLSDADPFVTRVQQGIADTNAEALVLEGSWPPADNTAELFAQSLASGSEWVALAPGDGARVAQLGFAPDLAARVGADLKNGRAVVVPKGTAQTAWWSVDPRTGETLGMGPNGWGASLVEYAFQLTIQLMMAQIACGAFTSAANSKIDALPDDEKGAAARKEVADTITQIGKDVKDTASDVANKGATKVLKEKYKAWARSCVSQSMLFSLTGISASWLMSRFFFGAKLPRWSNSPTGGKPTGEPPGGPPKPPGPLGKTKPYPGGTPGGGKPGSPGKTQPYPGGQPGGGNPDSPPGQNPRTPAPSQQPPRENPPPREPPERGSSEAKQRATDGRQQIEKEAEAAKQRATELGKKAAATESPEDEAAASKAWKDAYDAEDKAMMARAREGEQYELPNVGKGSFDEWAERQRAANAQLQQAVDNHNANPTEENWQKLLESNAAANQANREAAFAANREGRWGEFNSPKFPQTGGVSPPAGSTPKAGLDALGDTQFAKGGTVLMNMPAPANSASETGLNALGGSLRTLSLGRP